MCKLSPLWRKTLLCSSFNRPKFYSRFLWLHFFLLLLFLHSSHFLISFFSLVSIYWLHFVYMQFATRQLIPLKLSYLLYTFHAESIAQSEHQNIGFFSRAFNNQSDCTQHSRRLEFSRTNCNASLTMAYRRYIVRRRYGFTVNNVGL